MTATASVMRAVSAQHAFAAQGKLSHVMASLSQRTPWDRRTESIRTCRNRRWRCDSGRGHERHLRAESSEAQSDELQLDNRAVVDELFTALNFAVVSDQVDPFSIRRLNREVLAS